jgi:PAS domain S-box-containing protein
MYGMEIAIRPETEILGPSDSAGSIEGLSVGQRVEINARVEDGRWLARKIETRNVKPSDKIKGTPTRVRWESEGGVMEMHGLRVVLPPATEESTGSSLRQLRLATLMSVVLQEFRSAAHALVGNRGGGEEPAENLLDPEAPGFAGSAEERLDESLQALGYYLEQLKSPAVGADSASNPQDQRSALLERRLGALEQQRNVLEDLAKRDLAAASLYLEETIDPHLDRNMLPVVYALRGEAEETLSDQVRAIATRADASMRVALIVSVLAVLGMGILGWGLWRAVDAPIRALHSAALEIGHGHLETRVEVKTQGELGVLADAFNQMAEELASTTVSVKSLQSIFDSMAGILILLDADRKITNVNRGALRLLGYTREDLLGRPFDLVCARSSDASLEAALEQAQEGIAAVEELPLVRRNGSAVLVSFSSAGIRAENGPVQGYICIAQDLTEHKMIEEQVRTSLAEKEVLLRELHHRVKNNMQVISSLLAIQASYSSNAQTVRELEESQGRIQSMALIHELLHGAEDLARLDPNGYLDSLAAQLARSFGVSGGIGVEVELGAVPLDLDQALVCGLIVNELVTNALKHAFTDGSKGEIMIGLRDRGEETRILEVRDNGPGMKPPGGEKDQTLGLTLVRTLARQLGGQVFFEAGVGTTVRIEFPIKQTLGEIRT